MNRVIKFRRYHFFNENKKNVSHFDEWGVNVKIGNHIGDFVSPGYNNKALYFTDCQYTGLKDKNGVEIYEGDILLHPTNWLDPVDMQTFEIFTVVFNNGAFEMSDSKGERLWDWNEWAEVIGNIYEHPHLLNPEKDNKKFSIHNEG